MQHVEPETFDLFAVLQSTTGAYRDVYPDRQFDFVTELTAGPMSGSPELIIQMLDKLVVLKIFQRRGDDCERRA